MGVQSLCSPPREEKGPAPSQCSTPQCPLLEVKSIHCVCVCGGQNLCLLKEGLGKQHTNTSTLCDAFHQENREKAGGERTNERSYEWTNELSYDKRDFYHNSSMWYVVTIGKWGLTMSPLVYSNRREYPVCVCGCVNWTCCHSVIVSYRTNHLHSCYCLLPILLPSDFMSISTSIATYPCTSTRYWEHCVCTVAKLSLLIVYLFLKLFRLCCSLLVYTERTKH
jgi:hypothetical protein